MPDVRIMPIPIMVECWLAIEVLREREANSVTILCDNPEGNPNNAIECNGDWTYYEDRRFIGDTIYACLKAAVHAYEHWCKVEAERNLGNEGQRQ